MPDMMKMRLLYSKNIELYMHMQESIVHEGAKTFRPLIRSHSHQDPSLYDIALSFGTNDVRTEPGVTIQNQMHSTICLKATPFVNYADVLFLLTFLFPFPIPISAWKT